MADMPEVTLSIGDELHGFRVKAVAPIDKLRLVAYELEHIRTAAHLIHLHCDDAENLFSISFPTPPVDDTGVPHILEHSVLSGSRKFPVRDPFFEMLKMSMATFINAMTGWDCTYYPVCSNVKQDLFNLAEVYFDAVFHPLVTEEAFKREGHHLVPAKPDAPSGDLNINGVVYNEMKAAFSVPEARLSRLSMRSLFPDSTYGRESGGDPEHIPELTYDALKNFHRTLYHPSNGYFVFYGDIPTRDYLAFLEDRLAPFDRSEDLPEITGQSPWAEPHSLVETYSISAEDEASAKTFLHMDWLVGDGSDAQDCVMQHLLSTILFGNDAAPLKKAIIDSKLGQDVVQSGYGRLGLATVFRVGVKGSEPERMDAFRELVLTTLAEIADSKIDEELVTAAFQQLSYHCREIQSMQPLHMMQRVLDSWIYHSDPLVFLREADLLTACRLRYEAYSSIFNRMIRERLLENPHRSDLTLKPDAEWQARTDAAFAERMKAVRAQFSDEDVQRLATEAEELQQKAGTPNSPQALATLPQLKLGDLPPKPVHIPTSVERLSDDLDFLRNDVFSNGVNYLHLNIDLRGLPTELWPYLPRYVETINKLGAAGLSYEEMARRKSANTGGVYCHPNFTTRATDAAAVWGMRFSLKALDEQLDPALAVLHDLVFAADPRDGSRFHDVLVQTLAGLRTNLVNSGPGTARRYVTRGLVEEGHLDETVHGLPQLDLVGSLQERFDELSDDMMGKVEAIGKFLRNRSRIAASFTGSEESGETVRGTLADWQAQMPAEPATEQPTGFEPFEEIPRCGLAAPMQVAHCVQVIPAPHPSHPDAPLLMLGMQLLGVDYMISELRFKGNAYGASCYYGGSGLITLSTYADPHITRTLKVFTDLPDYVRKVDWTDAELHRGIISAAKTGMRPIRPEQATSQALGRHLTNETPDLRNERYAKLLAATASEVKRALLEVFDANQKHAPIGVVSSREKLEQANREMPDQPLAIRNILS